MTDEEIRHGGVKGNVILSSLLLLPELPTPVRFRSPGDMAHPCTFSHRAACTGTGTGTGTGRACKGSSLAPWEGCTSVGSDDVPQHRFAQHCLSVTRSSHAHAVTFPFTTHPEQQ